MYETKKKVSLTNISGCRHIYYNLIYVLFGYSIKSKNNTTQILEHPNIIWLGKLNRNFNVNLM